MSAENTAVIKDQVKLPISVALEVSLQGIRIRFGRSVVTVMGVMLGVAFLMSILSGQIIKKGVSDEAQTRSEVQRMQSFLTAEMGPPAERTIGLVQIGPLQDNERRLLDRLARQGLAAVRWYPARPGLALPSDLGKIATQVSPEELGEGANAILVMGPGEVPELPWASIFARAGQAVCCYTQTDYTLGLPTGATAVSLARKLHPDEIARRDKEKKKERFRSVWIVIISLAVTVICISNSLLMSVTERFREIGTMKCLGALSSFIRQLFLIESSIVGFAGSLLGTLFGLGFSTLVYGFTFGFGLVINSLDIGTLLLYFALSVVTGLVLSVLAALYPANFAARMVPGHALRTTI